MEAVEHYDVCEGITMSGSQLGDTLPSTNRKEEHSERNRKNVISMPASVLNGGREALIQEKGTRCVSEVPLSKEVNGQKGTTNTVTEISENSDSSEIANYSVDEIGSEGKISDSPEELNEHVTHLKQEAISATIKAENELSPKVEEPCQDAATQIKDDNSTLSDVTEPLGKATSTPDADISFKADTTVDDFSKPSVDSKETSLLNNDVNLSQNKSQNLTLTSEEMNPTEKSSDSKEVKENGSTTDDHHQKKNLSFEENQDLDPEMLRKKDPTKENATKVFRESYFMKTKGKIYYKKKGPFSKWRSQFVILDDNKQQMCFFKSQEEYEKLARCKNTIDLRFITEIKHQKQRIFQSNFSFKVYRRAGLSTVKLAADTEEERARWITTIQEITERIKATPERDLDVNQRSSTLPCIKNKKSTDDVSTDSETCTTSSAPEQDDLIRPKKVSKSGFKIDSNQISSIKLKRTSSQMRETRESKLPEEEEEEEVDTTPQEKFGVSLRRVNTEKPKTSRDDREKSPDYVEFKQKYNSLNTLRKNKTPNIPLNANSIVKTALIDNVEEEDRGIVYPSQILKENKDLSRKRSPSPNIPISKGVEAVMKNAEEESVTETTSTQNSLNVSQIRHATLAEVPQHEIVIEDLKICEILTDTQNEKQTSVAGQVDIPSIPTIQLAQLDSYEVEISEEHLNYHAANVVSEIKTVSKETLEIISNETAVVIDVNEPSDSSPEPNRESTAQTIVHSPEESSDPNTDPLKINAIKKFIQEMKSETSDTDSCNNLNVRVVDSSVENSPAIYPRKTSKEMKSEDSLLNIRLSTVSYGSQFSTESEEPLPRLNFLGRTDRSSTGSSVLKETISSDEHKSEKTSDSEEVSDLSGIIRMISTESSDLGGRSSLIAPEFTVVEENSEEIMSTAITNTSFESKVEETLENHRPVQVVKDEIVDAAEVVNKEFALESQAEVKILNHPKSEVATEISFDSDFQNESSENSNIAPIDSIEKEQKNQLKIVHQQELQTMPLETKDVVVAAVTTPVNEADDSKEEGKKYCNKMEMTLLSKTPEDNVKVKATFCKQISASSLHSEETVSFVDKTPERKSTPAVENIPQILTEKDASTTDSDGEIEILDTEETSDYFPSYGGADVEYRIKEDYLNIEQADSIRTSGIVGLKEFLKDNEDSCTSPTEIKSAISRLGSSPAIEKLKVELPKQQLP